MPSPVAPPLSFETIIAEATQLLRDERFEALERAGLTDRQTVGTYDTLASYTAGFRQHTGRRAPVAASDRLVGLREVDAAEFPHVAAYAELLTTREAIDGFDEGLDMILDGIAKHAGDKRRK